MTYDELAEMRWKEEHSHAVLRENPAWQKDGKSLRTPEQAEEEWEDYMEGRADPAPPVLDDFGLDQKWTQP